MRLLKILDYLLLFNVISLTIAEIFTDNIYYPASYVELIGTHTVYNIFKNPMSWNEARVFCRSIGSDLSKVPNEADVSAMGEEDKDVKKFFEDVYFTSAVRLSSDQVHWTSDCSYDSSQKGSPYEYKHSFNSSTCLEYHRTHFHNFENCSAVGDPFLCERKFRVPCTMSTILATEVVILNDMDESDCNESCDDDLACWGTITTPQHCIKVVIPGYGLSSLSFATKRCATFEAQYNKTTFSLPEELITEDLQRSKPPVPSCTNEIEYSSITPTLPSPHSTETSGQFATHIVTSTQFVTHTVMSTEFTTLHVTKTQQVAGPTVEITVSNPFTVTVKASISPLIDQTCVTSTPEIDTTSVISTLRIDTAPVPSTSQISSSGIEKITISTVEPTLVISAFSTVNDHTDLKTIHTKNTSTYRRSVTSAKDNRRTSIVIGVTGAALVIIPLWVIIITDIKKIFQHLCDHRAIYRMQ